MLYPNKTKQDNYGFLNFGFIKRSFKSLNPNKCFYFILTLLLLFQSIVPFLIPQKVYASSAFFSDGFSSGSSNWTPSSGAWLAEGGVYKHKEIGENYVTATTDALKDETFSSAAPTLTTTATPLNDSFTQADGAAANWTVVRGGPFAVSSNVYNVSGSNSLSTPTDSSFNNWSDYRLTTRFKRYGNAGDSGYAVLKFRLSVVNTTNDNSYALLFRQTSTNCGSMSGNVDLYKVVDASWNSCLRKATMTNDNDWHTVIVTAIGGEIKVWIDKAETEVPDIVHYDTTYATGTVGVASYTFNSDFDDVKVENLSTSIWSQKRGAFYTYNGSYYTSNNGLGSGRSLSVLSDSSYTSWNNYRITATLSRTGASSATGYAIIYFRTTMADATNENGYALTLGQTDNMRLFKVDNGWATSSLLANSTAVTLASDNTSHTVIINVTGNMARVWFDKAETDVPDLETRELTDYTAGTVGVGSNANVAGIFNSIEVENLLSISPAPSHLYTDSTSTLTFNSSTDMDNLQLTATNPSGTAWTLSNPAGCSGSKSCNVTFPTAFSGANITTLGTYTVSAVNGSDSAKVLLEVREKPTLAFAWMTDTHVQDGQDSEDNLGYTIEDINNSKDFPVPNFLVVTGDVSGNGLNADVAAAKAKFDTSNIAYYPMTGNHDTCQETTNEDKEVCTGDSSEMGHIWDNNFGGDKSKFTYSWTSGNYLFMAMDVEAPYGGYDSVPTSDLASTAHKNWLQSQLDANPGKKAFLFSHYALNALRDGGDASAHWQGEPGAATVRTIIEGDSNFVAAFAGHNHAYGESSSNGIYYLTAASLRYEDSYSYVEVYDDRMETHVIKKRAYRYDPRQNWPTSTDSTHTTTTYTFGLPIERQYKIDYTGKTNDIEDGITTAGNSTWSDYTYQADVTLGKERLWGENVGGLVFRYSNSNNYYSVVLDSAANTIKLQEKSSGAVTTISSAAATIDLDTAYTVKVTAQGNSIKVYLDNVLKIDTTDSTFTTGKIGLKSYLAATTFDNVSVNDLAVPAAFDVSSPADNSWTTTASPTLSWNASSDSESGMSNYQLFIDGSLNRDNISTSATSTTPASALADGSHTWYIKAVDAEGNTKQSTSTYTIRSDTTAPNAFDLDSPGDNSYTKDDRPTFKWKAATTPDATSGLSKYKLEIDNGDSGDFTIDDIPTSGTTDMTNDKYVIHFDNFSDSDNSNNYISVYTKSTPQWGSDNNDGKLKEGKRSWKVTAYDNAGNSKEESRTLFVDRTIPTLEPTQINSIPFKDNLITSNRKPSIFGKLTDVIAGDSSSTSEQVKQDNKVAAGPKNIEVRVEKQNYFGNYDLYILTTVTINDKYWTKDGSKISDNSKQISDKYSNFSYTPTDNLPYGAYKVTLTGKDDADNASSPKIFYLTIASFESIATPQEKIEEKLQITKPGTSPTSTPPKGVSGFFKNILGGITNTTGNIFNYFSKVTSYGSQTIGQGSKQPKYLISNIGEWLSYTTISFGEIVIDKEPTKITDVKVATLNRDSVIITWKTNHLATSKVNFGETLDYGKDIQFSTKVHNHKIEIKGLKPNTKYYYEVMSQNKNYVYDAHHEFVTLKE